MKPLILFHLMLAMVFCHPVLGQEISPGAEAEQVEISADRLEADDAASQLVFAGNAVARQGDLSIASDQLTIVYKGDDRQLDSIVAEGQVRIEQGGRIATAERAVYNKPEERITLTGSPLVKQGANSVSGQEIVLFLDGQRSIVKGGQNGRVNAVFQPGSGDGL